MHVPSPRLPIYRIRGMHPNVSYRCTTKSGAFSFFCRWWTRTLIKPGDVRRMGSHLPLGDRQACLPGVERANIRPREISIRLCAIYSVLHLYKKHTNLNYVCFSILSHISFLPATDKTQIITEYAKINNQALSFGKISTTKTKGRDTY